MQRISFLLAYPFIKAISFLPLKVLYFIGDYFLNPLLYKLIGYRKKVVQENLNSVFPEKSFEEKKIIEAKFYHFLTNLFVETIKAFSISSTTLDRRMSYSNEEVILDVYGKNKGVICTVGHIGNYEWMAQDFPRKRAVNLVVPYRRLTNRYFDHAFRKSRERGGAILFHTAETTTFLENNNNKVLLALANDQSAPPHKSFWTRFLNQDTSFFEGTEKVARKYNYPVFFGHITVVKRGHYKVTFVPITLNPQQEEIGFILEKHARLLEANILEAPEYWLWSHRRWKHQKPAGFTYGFTRDIES